MKKKLILALTLSVFGIASSVFAQISAPPKPDRTYSLANDGNNQVTSPGEQPTEGTPLAPATLLLLGLAGSFAGVKIYQNNKKEE